MAVVTKYDFIGEFGITQGKPIVSVSGGVGTDDLIGFIDREEKKILIDLMGYDMAIDFISNYDSDPDYAILFSTLTYNGRISFGIKEMLKGFIYYEYHKSGIKNVYQGQVVPKNETSRNANDTLKNSVLYNDAVDAYNVISNYIATNTATYDLYKSFNPTRRKIVL